MRIRVSRLLFTFGALGMCSLGIARPAQAQGVPVIDSQNLAQVVSIYKNAISQLTALQSTLNTMKEVNSAIGAVGSGNISAIAGWAAQFGISSPLTGLLTDYSQANSSLQLIASLGGNSGLVSQLGSSGYLSTFGNSRSMTQSLFYTTSTTPTTAEQDNIRAVRAQAARQSAQDGFALALSSRSQAAQVAQQGTQLENYVNSSLTVRGDIMANSMIEMANYKQLSQIVSILSAQLQLESAAEIAADGAMNTTVPQAQ